eukprot:Rhum_TRINITY_DN22932_c0_g1::Rhum_TRINITY_DN22932_c0_g1_i1::g.176399::m.176399
MWVFRKSTREPATGVAGLNFILAERLHLCLVVDDEGARMSEAQHHLVVLLKRVATDALVRRVGVGLPCQLLQGPAPVLHRERHDVHVRTFARVDHESAVEVQRVHAHVVAVDHERRPRGHRDTRRRGKVHRERRTEERERRGEPHQRPERRLDARKRGGSRRSDAHAQGTQKVHVHAVEVGLGREGAPGVLPRGGLRARVLQVVLAGGEGGPTVEGGEADVVARREQLGVVLHHALQTRRRLEHRLLGVRVLRVHELRHDAAALVQHAGVALRRNHQRVRVAGVGAEAGLGVGHVAELAARHSLQQRVDLVVLHVAHDGGAVLLLQRRDAPDSLACDAGHTHAGHRVLRAGCQANRGKHRVEGKAVRVLEEDNPLAPLFHPAVSDAVLVQKKVHVAVAVRLRRERVRVGSLRDEGRAVVLHRRHLLLLHNRHLRRRQPEVALTRQERHRLRMRVTRRHDDEGDVHGRLTGAYLLRKLLVAANVLAVERQVRLLRQQVRRQLDLDAVVPEALAEPAGHEHERGLPDLACAHTLVAEEVLAERVEEEPLRHLGHHALQGVVALLALLEEAAALRHVRLHAARVPSVDVDDALQEGTLAVLVGARLPRLHQVRLARRPQDLRTLRLHQTLGHGILMSSGGVSMKYRYCSFY